MAYKNVLKKLAGKKTKISFWDKILRQDIRLQANFVEMAGWVGTGLFLFLLLGIFLTVKIDISVPAQEARMDALGGNFMVEAVVAQSHAAALQAGQAVNIKFLPVFGKEIKCSGEVAEVMPRTDSLGMIIKVKPQLGPQDQAALEAGLKDIRMRVVIQKKKLFSIFLEKQ